MTCSQIQLTSQKMMGKMKGQDKYPVSVVTVYVAKPLKKFLKKIPPQSRWSIYYRRKRMHLDESFYPRMINRRLVFSKYFISPFYHQIPAGSTLYETGQWHKEAVTARVLFGIPATDHSSWYWTIHKGCSLPYRRQVKACICEGVTLKVAVSNKPISTVWL